jgi:PAS domain S-box-containing protein
MAKDSRRTKAELIGEIEHLRARLAQQAEDARRTTEERFRVLFEACPEGIAVADHATKRFLYANPTMCEMFGYTESEFCGLGVMDIHPRGALDSALEDFEACARGEQNVARGLPCRRKDGSVFQVDIAVGVAVFDGRPCSIGFFRDVTEHRCREKALRESQEAAHALLNVPHGVALMAELDGTIIALNEMAAKVIGSTVTELIGKRAYELLPPDVAAARRAVVREAVRLGEPVRGQDTAGGRLYDYRVYPVRNADGKVTRFAVFARDITEQNRTQERLSRLNGLFNRLGADANQNIDVIVQEACEILGGSSSFFNRLGDEGERLDTRSAYNAPGGFEPASRPEGRICYETVIKGRDKTVIIEELGTTEYAATDPNVGKYDWRSCIGHPIQVGGRSVGSLCVVDTHTREFTPTDMRIISTLAKALSLEEERMTAQKALREGEERYRHITRAVTDYIYTVRVEEGKPAETTHGAACLAVTGYTTQEFTDDPDLWLGMIVPEAREMVREQGARVVAGEPTHPIEYRITRKDGTVRWVNNTAVPHHSPEGRLLLYDGLIRDITERKIAEEARHQSETLLQTVINAAKDAIISIGEEGLVTIFNPAAEQMFGRTKKEMVGRALDALMPEEYQREHQGQIRGFFKTGEPSGAMGRVVELPGTRADGSTFPMEISLAVGQVERERFVVAVARDITARKEAESALRDGEERLRTILDSIQAGVLIVDPETHTIMDVNPAATRMLGGTRENIVGRKCSEFVCPSEESLCPITDLGQAMDNSECTLLTAAGEALPVLKTVTWVELDGRGHLLESFIDITERKRAEEALRKSRNFLQTIIDGIPEPLMVINRDHTIALANRAAVEGGEAWKHEDTGSLTCHLLSHGSDTPCGSLEHECPLQEVFRTGKPTALTHIHFDRDGTEYPVEIMAAPVFGDTGDVIQVIELCQNVAERRRAETERIRLTTAIEQAAEAIFVMDRDWTVQYANPAFGAMTGYAGDESVRLDADILRGGAHDAAYYRDIMETNERGENWQGRLITRKKDGTPYRAELTLSPVRDRSGSIANYVAVLRDVTHEEELEAHLRQAQKMEAIGTLAGGIAHDFNNILYAILGYADLAKVAVPDEGEVAEYLGEIEKAGYRARDLVARILTFSRQTEQERKPVRVQSVLKEAMELLRGSLPSTIEIRGHVDHGCGLVMADPTQVHQVVMNLCTNAYHSMRKDGGTLEISLKEVLVDHSAAAAHADLEPGWYARLTVGDTGHGMDADTLKHIFEPYFTTKPVGEGTGMGLATVHGIVRSYDGAVVVHSTRGEGTTFELFLPLHIQDVRPAESSAEVPGECRGKERILFVDDEAPVADIAQALLQQLGYRVVSRTSSVEALEAFRADPEGFDIVITDQTMPNMTGTHLACELMRIRPGIPIILCTGYSESVSRSQALSMGIREYVMKPIVAKDLAKTIRQVLAADDSA